MQVIHRIEDIRQALASLKQKNKTIGLVPTMGALHNGHLSLLSAANKQCDKTIATIFVNPAQFDQSSDLALYPRDAENDINKLQEAGCDLLFMPEIDEIYPEEPVLSMNFGYLEDVMEGQYRPGHFGGVGLIVAKLFNIIQPDQAYFGQKDLQQFVIINKMVEALNLPLKINMMPIIRESNGLAMSSRNRRLSKNEFELAANIYKSLINAKKLLNSGMPINEIIKLAKAYFTALPDIKLEYFEIVNLKTLKSIERLNPEEPLALCLACYLGEIRLIDNIVIEYKRQD